MRVAKKWNNNSLLTLNFDYNNITLDEPNNEYHIDGIDNDKLIQEVLENQDTKLDGDPTQSHFEDSVVLDTETSAHLLYEVDCIIKKNVDPFLKQDGHWAHIIHPHQSTMYHNHMKSGLGVSWVYWLKYPEYSGKLIFDFNILDFRVSLGFEPKVGTLLLFPTWIPHYTTRNVSNDTRISISGNHIQI